MRCVMFRNSLAIMSSTFCEKICSFLIAHHCASAQDSSFSKTRRRGHTLDLFRENLSLKSNPEDETPCTHKRTIRRESRFVINFISSSYLSLTISYYRSTYRPRYLHVCVNRSDSSHLIFFIKATVSAIRCIRGHATIVAKSVNHRVTFGTIMALKLVGQNSRLDLNAR